MTEKKSTEKKSAAKSMLENAKKGDEAAHKRLREKNPKPGVGQKILEKFYGASGYEAEVRMHEMAKQQAASKKGKK